MGIAYLPPSSDSYLLSGHSYNINNEADMKKTTQEDHSVIMKFLMLLGVDLKSRDITFDLSSVDISVGSTPSMFCHEKFETQNRVELHPGNYVFYDRQQLYTGACAKEYSIAGFVLARVIGHYRDSDRNSIMVDAGATALTKEQTPQGDVCGVFGKPELECYRMSQEITMIRCRNGGDIPFPFDDHPLGSTMLLVPNHSCLAAACFDVYHVVDEKGDQLSTNSRVIETWTPVKGWA